MHSTAMRRARMWACVDGDIYKDAFEHAAAGSWARRSIQLLDNYGIPDFPLCRAGTSYEAYGAIVRTALETMSRESWYNVAAGHKAQVPYVQFRVVPSIAIESAIAQTLPWDVQIGIRAWYRLRAGLVQLRAVSGKRSLNKYQHCLFCPDVVRNATVHLVVSCQHWSNERTKFLAVAALSREERANRKTFLFLGAQPESSVFPFVVKWADRVFKVAAVVWRQFDAVSSA